MPKGSQFEQVATLHFGNQSVAPALCSRAGNERLPGSGSSGTLYAGPRVFGRCVDSVSTSSLGKCTSVHIGLSLSLADAREGATAETIVGYHGPRLDGRAQWMPLGEAKAAS